MNSTGKVAPDKKSIRFKTTDEIAEAVRTFFATAVRNRPNGNIAATANASASSELPR